MPYSKEVREIHAEVRQYRLEEVADQLSELVETYPLGAGINRERAAIVVVQMIENERRAQGYYYEPCIMNRRVKPATIPFILNNWGEIVEIAALNEVYICWHPGRAKNATFRGTLEDWRICKRIVASIGHGLIEKQNRMAEVINRKGGKSTYIQTKETRRR